MYQLLVLLTGILTSVMISINGELASQYDVFFASAVIHLVGSVFAIILCALQKEKKPLLHHTPKWIYLGGAIGVITTVFQNLACSLINMTSIVALGLLGETVISLFIDGFGLFGMKKQPFSKTSIIGLVFALAGIGIMLDSSVTTAIIGIVVAFIPGITKVLSRTVNARLAEKTGALRSSLINHLVGLPITVIMALFLTSKDTVSLSVISNSKPWIYFGGFFGVAVILLLNVTVPKVSAFKLTVLSFVGQIFAGFLIDLMVGNPFDSSFFGGLVVSVGIALNFAVEAFENRRSKKEAAV